MSDIAPKKVVAIRTEPCVDSERIHHGRHVKFLRLEDGSDVDAADAMALMDAGGLFVMTPPPGAPAYEAHRATGLDLMLQTRTCEDCGERVLFA